MQKICKIGAFFVFYTSVLLQQENRIVILSVNFVLLNTSVSEATAIKKLNN